MKRNDGLDSLKFICAFLVICIHIPFPNTIGTVVIPLTRVAVPIFFMITGYFYSYIVEKGAQKRQLVKLTKVFFCSNLLYLFINILSRVESSKQLVEFKNNILDIKVILEFVFLNESPFGGHLWYVGAILYVLVIVFLWERSGMRRDTLYFLVPFLLLTDLVMGKYSLLLWGRSFPYIWVRNFLCVGLPYFLIGDMLFKFNPKVKKRGLILLSLLFICTTLFERYLLGIMNLNAPRDHYISTTLLAISLFLLALQCGAKNGNKLYRILCFIGARLTLGIYVLHPIIIIVINKVVQSVGNNELVAVVYDYVAPFCVYIVSIVVSYCIYFINNKVKLIRNINKE